MEISIRKSIATDLEFFFNNQTDEQANHMAAFTPKDPNDKQAYLTKWNRLMKNDTVHMQTIIYKNTVIGCVIKFVIEGDAEITYAIDKEYWGKGFTTIAVLQFLKEETNRPIHGRVAFDNLGSQRILEKTGFIKTGKDIGFANARGKYIEEFIYKLE